MNNKPLVSVIIAVYNAEKYLRQCLDGIKDQTLSNIEIICVNDGSNDRSLDILNEYAGKDKRFRILTKENEGLGGASARNYGLDMACGKYISILDSDDFFDLNMLKHAYEKAVSVQADIVVFGGCEYDERTGNVNKVASILNQSVIPEKEVFSYHDCAESIYQLTQGMAWNKLYKKEFIDTHGIRFQRIKYTDDAYFTFAHMVLAERIAVLNECLCYYRINTGISQTDGLANYPDSAYVPYVSLKRSLIEWGCYEEVKHSFMNCAAAFLRYFYDKIKRYKSFEYLHNKYREEIFDVLDIPTNNDVDFYDPRLALWVKQVSEHSPGEMLFETVLASGTENTTSMMRFRLPFNKIKRDSRIALIGAGIIGRHFYSQIILSGYCDVVCWVETNNHGNCSYVKDYSSLDNAEFDLAVIAYAQPALIENAIKYLKKLGISEERIIFGGIN